MVQYSLPDLTMPDAEDEDEIEEDHERLVGRLNADHQRVHGVHHLDVETQPYKHRPFNYIKTPNPKCRLYWCSIDRLELHLVMLVFSTPLVN